MGDVNIEHLTKRYGDVVAVNDVNLAIEDGEFVTFVGPSGCGKSTTLEMVAGLTKPSEGTVSIAGQDVTNLPPKDRRIAMVFQNIALFPHMDVYDNISFGLRLRDYGKEEIDRRVDRAAEIVQMSGMLDRKPDEMSGGQRQRVAIARALVREPEVFLMDEPLANLDARLRVHMRTELQRLHKELDTTIIYVTHDQAEAMTMSNRIAVLNDGELQQFAAPLTCYNEPTNEFVAGFIGSPSMNFARGTINERGLTTPYFDVAFDPGNFGLAAGDEVTLGVRPENVHRVDADETRGEPTEPISARTDVIEPMGDEIFVYLLLDDGAGTDEGMTEEASEDQLLMSIPPDPEFTRGEAEDRELDVVLDREHVHLFDTESGDAIAHGLREGMGGTGAAEGEARGD